MYGRIGTVARKGGLEFSCVRVLFCSSFFSGFVFIFGSLLHTLLDECPYGGYTTPTRMNEYGHFIRTSSCSRLRGLDQDFENALGDWYECCLVEKSCHGRLIILQLISHGVSFS